MKKVIVTLKSTSPYSQSKHHATEKKTKELPDAYETRTWRERLHCNDEGEMFIPPMQFSNCVKEAAKYLSIQIPGKGKSTFTKHFDAGVMVLEKFMLGIHKNDVPMETVHVPSDGRKGGSKRVLKNFGVIQQWQGDVVFHILDDIITEDIFRQVLEAAGNVIGIGRWRPRNGGLYGRFEIVKLKFIEK